MRHFINKLAAKAGYEITAQWRSKELPHERKLRAIFEHFGIAYVIDVGANEGQFHDFLRMNVGFRGEIHSFEPIAALVEKMTARPDHDPAWFVRQYALGSDQARQEINVMNSTLFSSFLEPRHDVMQGFTQWNTIARKETVAITTLDRYVMELGKTIDLRRTFLKLDTQGYDLEVLKGAATALAEIPVVQSEMSLRPIYSGMPTMSDSIAAFGLHGFAISDMFLVSCDKDLRAIEFDCLMVKGTR